MVQERLDLDLSDELFYKFLLDDCFLLDDLDS